MSQSQGKLITTLLEEFCVNRSSTTGEATGEREVPGTQAATTVLIGEAALLLMWPIWQQRFWASPALWPQPGHLAHFWTGSCFSQTGEGQQRTNPNFHCVPSRGGNIPTCLQETHRLTLSSNSDKSVFYIRMGRFRNLCQFFSIALSPLEWFLLTSRFSGRGQMESGAKSPQYGYRQQQK